MKGFILKRIYEEPSNQDGYRILLDRLWPRGISKEEAKLDEWDKELGPSNELRKWFNHEDDKYEEFKARYKEELKVQTATLVRIKKLAEQQQVCLLFGAKNEKHNQAVVVKEVLETM